MSASIDQNMNGMEAVASVLVPAPVPHPFSASLIPSQSSTFIIRVANPHPLSEYPWFSQVQYHAATTSASATYMNATVNAIYIRHRHYTISPHLVHASP